jgi:hypothetical protein
MVIETPPNVLGFLNDAWFHYVIDFGNAGPDQGKGGKFLILPPGYEGDIPEGYHVAKSPTFGNWVVWRGFQVDGSPKPAVEATKKLFKINLPKDVPAKDFWSFTLYDNQIRAMLQTDQRFPGVDQNKKGLKQNADGSYDVYFSPKAPAGQENNWIQTDPNQGWNTIFRLYGPLEPFYDKTLIPGDPELLD